MAKRNIPVAKPVEEIVQTNDILENAEKKVTNPVDDKKEVQYCTVVNCDRLRVREEASDTAKVLTVVDKGTKLIFKNKKDATWSHVQTQTGHDGYVMSKYIKKD